MGVKKSAVCRSRPPPNGMNPASSRVSIPLTKLSSDPGASPLSACSRSPGANLEAQPAFVEYFVSLMRVRSSIASRVYPRAASGPDGRSQDPGNSVNMRKVMTQLYALRICRLTDAWAAGAFIIDFAEKTSAK
jgi:hypothetical protein